MPNILASLFLAAKAFRDSIPGYGGESYTLLSPQDRGATKAIEFPMFGSGYGSLTATPYLAPISFGNRYRGTNINYDVEVGDLTQSSIVMAAVNWFATVLPEAPVCVKEEGPDGTDKVVVGHPLAKLIARPNAYDSGELLLRAFALSWFIDGNVYWEKVRSKRGRLAELWWWPHFLVQPRRTSKSELVSYYEVRIDGRARRVDPKDMVHFRNGKDPNSLAKGLSPVGSVLREIYTDNQIANMTAALARNLGVPPLVVAARKDASNAKMDPEQIADQILRVTTGDQYGKLLVLTGPLEAKPMSFNPEQMDLTRQRRLPEERLAAVINIPPIVLGFGAGLEHATYANYKIAKEQAYESMVIPTQRIIASVLTTQVLTELDADERRYVAFDNSEVRALQDDKVSESARLASLVKNGVITRAEAKRELGMKATERDEVYLLPAGIVEVPAEKPQEPVQPDQPEQPEPPGNEPQPPKEKAVKALPADDPDLAAMEKGQPSEKFLKQLREFYQSRPSVPEKYKGLLDATEHKPS